MVWHIKSIFYILFYILVSVNFLYAQKNVSPVDKQQVIESLEHFVYAANTGNYHAAISHISPYRTDIIEGIQSNVRTKKTGRSRSYVIFVKNEKTEEKLNKYYLAHEVLNKNIEMAYDGKRVKVTQALMGEGIFGMRGPYVYFVFEKCGSMWLIVDTDFHKPIPTWFFIITAITYLLFGFLFWKMRDFIASFTFTTERAKPVFDSYSTSRYPKWFFIIFFITLLVCGLWILMLVESMMISLSHPIENNLVWWLLPIIWSIIVLAIYYLFVEYKNEIGN